MAEREQYRKLQFAKVLFFNEKQCTGRENLSLFYELRPIMQALLSKTPAELE
jgi:hypothetical protein